MKQGYDFGTLVRLSEEIIKTLKNVPVVSLPFILVKFRLITVLWLAILSPGSDEIFNFLLTSIQKEYIPKLQIITEFTR